MFLETVQIVLLYIVTENVVHADVASTRLAVKMLLNDRLFSALYEPIGRSYYRHYVWCAG